MGAMPFVTLRRSDDDRVVAGVCAGIAKAIGVDPTLVRLVFTLLALAGGAGLVLYGAAWLYMSGKGVLAAIAVVAAAGFALRGLGLSAHAAAALVLIACGLAVIWYRGGSLRPGAPLSLAGLALVGLGAVVLLFGGGGSSLLAPGAIGGALVLILGPWLWQLALERDAERTARIRTEERAEVDVDAHEDDCGDDRRQDQEAETDERDREAAAPSRDRGHALDRSRVP